MPPPAWLENTAQPGQQLDPTQAEWTNFHTYVPRFRSFSFRLEKVRMHISLYQSPTLHASAPPLPARLISTDLWFLRLEQWLCLDKVSPALPHTQQQQCCRCLLCARLFTITGDIYYSFLLCSFVRNQNQSRAGQGPGEVTRCCIQCIVRQHVPRSAAQPRIASLHQLSIRCLPGAWCLQLAQERSRPQHWSRGDAELYFLK